MIDISQITPFATSGGIGFILGGVTGYALKKVAKIGAVIVGLFIAGLAFLEYHKVVSVNWTVATAYANSTLTFMYHQVAPILNDAGGHINTVVGVAGGSFIAGGMLGFMKG